ncbi:MAG: radical SAM protein [Chitinivibrionales bacterium]|nr:radical SAM protein [Chitinivibrionales bacterium]
MKILALNPPFLHRYSRESRSPAVTRSGTLYYPMWLAYSVAYLEKHDHEVLFIDAPAAELDAAQVYEKAKEFQPQMAILDTSTPSIYSDIEVAEGLKKALPDIFVTLVGVHVSALPEETLQLNDAVDAVAFREYDATVVELAEKIVHSRDDTSLESVKGIAYRTQKGEIRKNEPRPYIENLDDIPLVSSVYKRHLGTKPYFYGHSRYPLVVIISGRGCPFHCTYCVIPQTLQGHKYRTRSVANVVEEFRYVAENMPEVKEIMIEDDTLTANKKRCRELSDTLIKEKMTRIPWSANSRPDVDIDTMRLMKKAGCRLFCVGLESGDQQILDNIKKGTKIERIRQFVKDARRAGILVHGCFMVGNRGETRETLEKTLQLAKDLNPDTAQFYPIMIYPGTEDYAYFDEKGWMVTHNFRKWLNEEGLHSSVVSNPDLTYEELCAFCDRSRREFYLRFSYMTAKFIQIMRHPGEARRVFKGFLNIYKYLLNSSPKSG